MKHRTNYLAAELGDGRFLFDKQPELGQSIVMSSLRVPQETEKKLSNILRDVSKIMKYDSQFFYN